MTPKEKAEELLYTYRILLMLEETECGNEILCTVIAKQCALILVSEMKKQCWDYRDIDLQASYDYWIQIEKEIEKL